MKIEKRTKNLGLFIISILAIIVIISVIFLSLQTSQATLTVTVYNTSDQKLYLDCVYYYVIGTGEPTMKLFYDSINAGGSCIFSYKIDNNKKIVKIDISTYDSSLYDLDKRTAYKAYEYPDGQSYNMIAIINETGSKITFVQP